MRNINAILTIASRDYLKFLRDRGRIIASFIFPFLFIGILGSSLQGSFAEEAGYNFLGFVFTGVLGQTLFQSTASGLISLIQDRTSDFSQELFVSPVSRFAIIFGKIFGETLVAISQGIGVILFALIIGVPFNFTQVVGLIPAFFVACLLGGAFGLLVLANLDSERGANQIFPFVIFPQFFLSGIFSPIKNLPLPLDILSHLSPMRYAVDFGRGLYYAGTPEYEKIVLMSPIQNIIIISIMFAVFMILGTTLFVKNERNR